LTESPWIRSPESAGPAAYDKPLCASLDGFTLHAAARAGALDQAGRQALLRYVLRPPVAQERVELRPDGLVRGFRPRSDQERDHVHALVSRGGFSASGERIPVPYVDEGAAAAPAEEHHGNWLECIRSRKEPIAPAEVAHRSCSACLLHHAAMKTKRKLYWDPQKERFRNDDEANAMLSRPQRWPYGIG